MGSCVLFSSIKEINRLTRKEICVLGYCLVQLKKEIG